ncbi:formimidoylglutamate deiminase [Rhodanobacter spathiphylli]|uniref:N-formimino-L-glutamate deiminase n=1 Tax=Rhodanobacter spathiphylli B39 TaxID=1163407 RepID=I4W020_9GAMM|nr:formimidoylglutamate deiminase [Rhodanobacter spathiphylli]EIL92811.1 N-formimino-L-glutamate deiminase [Rhodanobacter spathiphylli B39]
MSEWASPSGFEAGQLWRGHGWLADDRFGLSSAGALLDCAGPQAPIGSWVLPGMPNLHSHAFQRAMAGLAERRSKAEDSFWSWRETMYAFAAAITPEQLKAIASQLYVEMLKSGYTRVCEFHYLHHQPDGTPYAQPAAMSLALIEAAREAGIGLTLLPVLYMSGGFDGRALSARQRRFGHSVDGYLRLLESLRAHEDDAVRVGIALHSLRAVPEQALAEVLASPLARTGPIHIHIAEQIGEVQDCLATRGARPVEWLFEHADVDERWCLVHATHLTEAETAQLARSGAVAGLCPTTEANLGDGLFPLADFLDAGGTLGVGSDSHISISPVEELRWLEYGQRLATRHRNIAARQQGDSVGETLWRAALAGGARASGAPVGELRAGARADLIVLDDASPLLAARDTRSLIDSFLFSGNTPLVRDVMVGGRWQVRDFRHRDEAAIAARYRAAVGALAAR